MKLLGILASCLTLLASGPVHAQSWPTSPIHMIVPFGAGGTADILARLVAERLHQPLGQPVVVEDRPGAGGNVGAAAVARANPDGYTLLFSGSPTHSVGPHLFKNLSYDPMRDVPPVAMVAAGPNLLVVNSSLPVKSLNDLIELARKRPNPLTYSSAGVGTSGHLAAELLAKAAGIKAQHVPFKSGPEAVTAVLAGQIDFMFFTVPPLLPHVKTGKLRALAITSTTRSQLVPDVPTVVEAGYPGFEVLGWYAMFAPRGMPAAITTKLSDEIGKIVAAPEVQKKMLLLGVEPKFMNAADLTRFITTESAMWGDLIKAAGLAPQ